jgi:hypothetical protein
LQGRENIKRRRRHLVLFIFVNWTYTVSKKSHKLQTSVEFWACHSSER